MSNAYQPCCSNPLEEEVYDRGLSDTWLSSDEDDLTLSTFRVAEPLLEPCYFVRASNDLFSFGGFLGGRAKRFSSIGCPHKPIALPSNGFDVVRSLGRIC
jgi:hypothetical protein